jgi:hypothetical protein
MKTTHSIPQPTAGSAPETTKSSEASPGSRRAYRPPRITAHGPMVRIALGGSPGVGDSSNPSVQQPPA